MDLRMPVMSGWELLEALRSDAELASIPVVVMAGNANKRELGAMRVMRKPVEMRAILDVIGEYCG